MTSTSTVLVVTAPANGVPGPAQGCWNYDAYAAIPDDGHRYEVIRGVLYMAPAPDVAHQRAVLQFAIILTAHVAEAGCGDVLISPIDVELVPGGDIVQPDVLVVLDANREVILPSRIQGAPDLVVEVTSPGTSTYDRRGKMDAYARGGVAEYWVADPYAQTVELLLLEQGAYRSAGVFAGEALPLSRAIPGLPVHVDQFFA